MNRVERINRKINKRKYKHNLVGEIKELETEKSSKWFKALMGIMAIYAIFISVAIYAKKDENATALNSLFNNNINFNSLNKTLNKLINFRVVNSVDDSVKDQVVSSNVTYLDLGNDYYTSEGNLVVAMDDGVITYVNGKDDSYTVIVEYDSGVRATYNEVNEVNVFVNDRIYKEDILGSFDDEVQIIFIKDKTKLSYEEVMAII